MKSFETKRRCRSRQRFAKNIHHAFTLIELLITMAIIGLLTSILLVTLSRIQLQAKQKRTQQQIKKIDQLVRPLYEELLTTPLAVQFAPLGPAPPSDNPNFNDYLLRLKQRRFQILCCRRELLRMELPDRKTDVLTDSYLFADGSRMQMPSRLQAFRSMRTSQWSTQYQGSECLYLILSTLKDRDVNAIDFLLPSEIGDLDNDGMPEVLDAFGNPLGFLRWAPGISSRPGIDGYWGSCDPSDPTNNPEGALGDRDNDGYDDADDDKNGVINDASEVGMGINDDYRSFSAVQSVNPKLSPDWTDAGGADIRLTDRVPTNDPFNLFPLICSAGRDSKFGVFGLGGQSEYEGITNQGYIELLEFNYRSTKLQHGTPPYGDTAFQQPYDPFHYHHPNTNREGFPQQFGAFLHNGIHDNISNHDIEEAQ